jgi:hypothetical protein
MAHASAGLVPAPPEKATVSSYFRSFSTRSLSDVVRWPPDIFALTNLVLDHTEAYRFAVSPPGGSRWPPEPGWEQSVGAAAAEWRESAAAESAGIPASVARHWEWLVGHLATPLTALRAGEEHGLCESLLTLHAMADETCRGLTWLPGGSSDGRFERRAWDLLARHGSLSYIDSTRVRITPKVHSAARGITIRSLSRYLALGYESIDVRWRRIDRMRPPGSDRRALNMLLVPWPLGFRASAFRVVEGPLQNMDPGSFGFFQFDPGTSLDLSHLRRLVEAARRIVDSIDAVIFPEAAMEAREVSAVEDLLADLGVLSLFAGIREEAGPNGLGRNYVRVSVRTDDGWESYQQAKHHRWCLDEPQIRQYHLTRALEPSRQWWEAIDLPARTLEVIDVGDGGVTVPLICEDLARMDEVSDLLRRIGPSLVVALLLDGPQLPRRWPCRYASVLADEPGSAVLTLSSLGMVTRCRPAGMPRSRVVAMWSDPRSGTHQIELSRGASGVLITAFAVPETVWTADGRCHEQNTSSLRLTRVHQLRLPSSSESDAVIELKESV